MRSGRVAALILSTTAFAGCASTGVNSYLAHGADIARYRTYDWGTSGRLETGDPRLDNNPFLEERIQADVEKQLASRGFRKISSGMPELLVRYHVHLTQQVDIVPADQDYGACRGCTAYVHESGTLVIDFVDVQTDELVWRGWAEKSFDGSIDDQDRMEQTIERAVARILQELPGSQ